MLDKQIETWIGEGILVGYGYIDTPKGRLHYYSNGTFGVVKNGNMRSISQEEAEVMLNARKSNKTAPSCEDEK